MTQHDLITAAIRAIKGKDPSFALAMIERAIEEPGHLPAVIDYLIAGKVYLRDFGMVSNATACLETAGQLIEEALVS